jgi:hypothetical protein
MIIAATRACNMGVTSLATIAYCVHMQVVSSQT